MSMCGLIMRMHKNRVIVGSGRIVTWAKTVYPTALLVILNRWTISGHPGATAM